MKKVEFSINENTTRERYETKIELIIRMLYLFLSSTYVSKERIIEDLKISERTFYRYRKILEKAGIYMVAQSNGVLCLDEKRTPIRLDRVAWNEDEALAFIISSYLVENYSDDSVRYNFASAINKVKSGMEYENKEAISELINKITTKKRIPYHQQRFPHNYLIKFQKAIIDNKIINIRYYIFHKDKLSRRDIIPVGMVYTSL